MKKLLLYSSFFIKSAFITVFMKCRTPEAAEGPPGVLFVFKTPISAKKIQKHEILLCKKSLFSLHKQNKEIPYKKSWFRKFFVRNSSFLDYLHQTNSPVTTGKKIFGSEITKIQISR